MSHCGRGKPLEGGEVGPGVDAYVRSVDLGHW